MNKWVLTIGVLGMAFVSSQTYAARPSITSLQEQINQLQAQINQLNSQPKAVVVKDANGAYIGRLITTTGYSAPGILTDKGYRTGLRRIDGTIMNSYSNFGGYPYDDARIIAFESGDCSGVGYLQSHGLRGTVYSRPINDTQYAISYTENNAVWTTINKFSFLGPGGGATGASCFTANGETFQGYPVHLNDPTITGVQNSYPEPLSIE